MTMLRRGACAALLAAGGWCAVPARGAAEAASRVAVVANASVPESVELARQYLAARGIPETNLVLLDLPAGETMTRWHYKHRLLDPLLAALRERGLIEQVQRAEDPSDRYQSGWRTIAASIDYLVSMYGVPLKIADRKPFSLGRLSTLVQNPSLTDGAAVDSELALALLDDYSLDGPFNNPLYREHVVPAAQNPGRKILLATRLDGPTPDAVRDLMDRTLEAEARGLQGYGWFDLQNIQDPGYALGDYWIWEASERLAREGFSVFRDLEPSPIPASEPLGKVAVYLGWYSPDVTGPFADPGFRFAPGAVAYHLHSGSAKSIRTADKHWVGPLVARGACAVMGAVEEPYLRYTPDLKALMEQLCGGATFGVAAYASQRTLSWQITVVGDPLYQPFAEPPEILRDRLDAAGDPGAEWMTLRVANRMVREGIFNPALALLRNRIRRTDSPVLRLRLADLYALNQLEEYAIDLYREVAREADAAPTAVRAGRSAAALLRTRNRNEEADALIQELRAAWPEAPSVEALTLPRR